MSDRLYSYHKETLGLIAAIEPDMTLSTSSRTVVPYRSLITAWSRMRSQDNRVKTREYIGNCIRETLVFLRDRVLPIIQIDEMTDLLMRVHSSCSCLIETYASDAITGRYYRSIQTEILTFLSSFRIHRGSQYLPDNPSSLRLLVETCSVDSLEEPTFKQPHKQSSCLNLGKPAIRREYDFSEIGKEEDDLIDFDGTETRSLFLPTLITACDYVEIDVDEHI